MWNRPQENWTHDLDAYNRMRQAQARAAGGTLSPHADPSGFSSPGLDAESSGILGPLADLQVSRRGAEATQAHLAPRSAALAPRDRGPESLRAHHVQVWHSHTPDSQWVTQLEADLEEAATPDSQWVTELEADLESATTPDSQWATQLEAELEQATEQDEGGTQDRPAVPRRGLFSQIGGAIRRAAGSNETARPYPDDKALTERFAEAALAGGSDPGTVKAYRILLNRFSAWLKHQHLDAIHDRLNSRQLTLDVERFASEPRKQSNAAAAAALEHLRAVINGQDSALRIADRETAKYTVSAEDQSFIDRAFPVDNEDRTTATYRTALHAFSGWLQSNGLGGLRDSFHSDGLMLNAEICAVETGHGDRLLVALRHLQGADRGGKVTIQRKAKTRDIPEVDKQLVSDFQAALSAAGKAGKADLRGRTLSDKHATELRSFSAFLLGKDKGPIATRLRDPGLDRDLAAWTEGKSKSRIGQMKSLLEQVRKMLSNVPSPQSSFVTPTSEDFAQFDWTLLQTPGVTSDPQPDPWGRASDVQGGYDLYGMSASHGYDIPWQTDGVYGSSLGDGSAAHLPDLSHVVGSGWRHGPQRASDVLIGALENQGLLPSAYVPETTFYIHNERYTAQLGPGLREATQNNPRGVDVRLLHRLQGG